MNDATSQGKGIKSAETVFDILETLADQECTTVSGIADRLDYSKSTIYYYLRTMERKRYITRENGDYRLGLRTVSLGAKAMHQYDPQNFIQEQIDGLAREVDVAVDVLVEEAGKGMVLHRSRTDDDREIDTHVGMEIDLDRTAFGKAILAFLPADRREEILSGDSQGDGTDEPGIEHEELVPEMETIQQIGLAYTEEEYVEGMSSIAAPIIRESSGEVYGSIGIWAPSNELTDPTRHAKARRFAGDLPEEVEMVARIIGGRI